MKHHVVFCYQEHGAVMASTTIETEAYDPLPGSEAWLEMVKKKCADEVNYDVVVVSWQALLETATEVVQREKTFAERRDEGVAQGRAEYARRKAAIEASRHRCGDCDHFPPAGIEHVAAICGRAGVLVTDTTRTLCRHFHEKVMP